MAASGSHMNEDRVFAKCAWRLMPLNSRVIPGELCGAKHGKGIHQARVGAPQESLSHRWRGADGFPSLAATRLAGNDTSFDCVVSYAVGAE
jgi:hypothetical protein